VVQHLEAILVDQDHDTLAGMGQADLEPLAANLNLSALADNPLDGDRPSDRLGRQAGHPSTRQPVPQLGRDRRRQCLDHPAVAHHLQQRRGDPDRDLPACPQQPNPDLAAPDAQQPTAVDHPVDLDHGRALQRRGRRRRRPGRVASESVAKRAGLAVTDETRTTDKHQHTERLWRRRLPPADLRYSSA
jgi:hypothetical protein